LKKRELEGRIATMEEEMCGAEAAFLAIMRDLGPVDDKIVAALAARKAKGFKKGKKKNGKKKNGKKKGGGFTSSSCT
jgi:hypothetical protein